MRDDETPAPKAERPGLRWEEIARMKVTPLVFLAFFAFLAVMTGAAAIVGYTVYQMEKAAPHGP